MQVSETRDSQNQVYLGLLIDISVYIVGHFVSVFCAAPALSSAHAAHDIAATANLSRSSALAFVVL